MKENEIQLIKEPRSYVNVEQQEAGQMLHDRLFEVVPELRPLFSSNIKSQENKPFDSVILVVAKLDKPEKNAGTKPEHFEIVGISLIWTLKTEPANKSKLNGRGHDAYRTLSKLWLKI